jgi:glycogen debranching enzyme
VNYADGRLVEAPVALAEVQGYVYAAFLARADLATRLADPDTAAEYVAAAERLKAQFNEAFWLPDRGYYAIALDRHKQPVDALASNMGHCLWSGIVADEHAAEVVAHLMSDEMFSGWGIRTLGTSMSRYNPMSYHNGSVWPHDNALIVGGFRRYGFIQEAQRLSMALIEASGMSAGRLPELFCGFPRRDFPQPVPYPTSCSPQAWAAATPVHLLRVMLGIQPDLPGGRLEIVPHLAPELGEVRLGNLPLGDARLRLRARTSDAEVSGVPFGLAATSEDVTMTFRVSAAPGPERRRT